MTTYPLSLYLNQKESYSCRAELAVMHLSASYNPLKSVLLNRLITSIALPILHGIDTSKCLYSALKSRITHTPSYHHLTEAKHHFKQIFTCIFWGIISPMRAITLPPKMIASLHLKQGISCKMGPSSRLGDNMGSYMAAKWVAHKLGIPLIVQPFPHADEVKILQNAQYIEPPTLLKWNKVSEATLTPAVEASIKQGGFHQLPFLFNAQIDWNDKVFVHSLLNDLSPTVSVSSPELKSNAVNVAIHYRDGGNFDSFFDKFIMPTKFPTLEYYQEQMRYLIEKHPGQNVHFEIFTDSLNVPALKKEFQDFLATLPKGSQNISLNIRPPASEKELESQVIQDMCLMSKYDCLIRADSGLSKLSGLIGSIPIEIMPANFKGEANNKKVEVEINQVKIVFRDKEAGSTCCEYKHCSFKRSTRPFPTISPANIRSWWGQ